MDPDAAAAAQQKALMKVQYYLDKAVPWVKARWGSLAGLLVLYLCRVWLVHGFYIVTYGLSIYLLNLLINFLSPAVDPEAEDGPALPLSGENSKPFVRKLPEFKFWLAAIKASVGAFMMTAFSVFDLPVFWPILLAYFVLLVVLTAKDRIKHMVKHNYVPWQGAFGKETYGDLTKVNAGKGGASKPTMKRTD